MRQLALTAIGEDRPGIVAAVCRVVFEAGGNLRDTSMTILSGQFAMIVVVGVEPSLDLRTLDRAFDPVRKELGIEVFVRELSPSHLEAALGAEAEMALVQVMGPDRPGIVYRVADAMAKRSINISDVETRLAGDAAKPLYVVLMEVCLPPSVEAAALASDLAELGRELAVEITVRPVRTSTL